METENKQPYISDASQPNAGRIYDYLIGGSHNFDVDRQAVDKILQVAPFGAKMAKLIRLFLRISIKRMVDHGFTNFIDFASGLPVDDHIHRNTPEGSKVIYSDIDPITVDYGREIIGDNPNVKYEFCDASKPEILLKSDTLKNLFGNNHKVAIGFNGVSYFLTDEQLKHAMNVLYEWAGEGTMLFICDIDGENINKDFQTLIDLYNNINQFVRIRTKDLFSDLVKPWKIVDPGFCVFEKWMGLYPEITIEFTKALGSGGFFGGYLMK